MKKFWCVVPLALILATGACAAEIPNLLGNWIGTWNGYLENEFSGSDENGSINYTFTEQEGRIFIGEISFMQEDGTEGVKEFVGAIDIDNQTLYAAESDEGYWHGDVISENEIELIYLQDGEDIEVSIDRIHRVED